MLVFVAGYAGIYGKQMLFFKDGELSRRAKIAQTECSGRTRDPGTNPLSLAAKIEHLALDGVLGGSDPDSPSIDFIREIYENGVLTEITRVPLDEENEEAKEASKREEFAPSDEPQEESGGEKACVPSLGEMPGAEHVRDALRERLPGK
jgi:hypothetical protein